MTDIPLLDWQDYRSGNDGDRFRAQLAKSFRHTGFALLHNHGISLELMARTFEQADHFFDLPIVEKARLDITNNPHNRGWARQGSERLDENSEHVDAKEAFNVGFDLHANDPRIGQPFRGLNIWPNIDGFRDVILAYYNAIWKLGVDLHAPIAEDLNLPSDYFTNRFSAPMATLRLLRYPPATGVEGEIGAGAHTDYGSITLLLTDGEPGLQVRPRGADWLDVPHIAGALIVNIGDCLMRWTNDIYVSTPHRVMPPKRSRRSIAFFLDPNPDAMIEALPGTGEPKYPGILAADYLRSRLDATYTK